MNLEEYIKRVEEASDMMHYDPGPTKSKTISPDAKKQKKKIATHQQTQEFIERARNAKRGVDVTDMTSKEFLRFLDQS